MNRPSGDPMNRGVIVGRVIVTTHRQPSGAPLLDGARTTDAEGRDYGALVVRVPARTVCLVVGLRGARVPNPHPYRRLGPGPTGQGESGPR